MAPRITPSVTKEPHKFARFISTHHNTDENSRPIPWGNLWTQEFCTHKNVPKWACVCDFPVALQLFEGFCSLRKMFHPTHNRKPYQRNDGFEALIEQQQHHQILPHSIEYLMWREQCRIRLMIKVLGSRKKLGRFKSNESEPFRGLKSYRKHLRMLITIPSSGVELQMRENWMQTGKEIRCSHSVRFFEYEMPHIPIACSHTSRKNSSLHWKSFCRASRRFWNRMRTTVASCYWCTEFA